MRDQIIDLRQPRYAYSDFKGLLVTEGEIHLRIVKLAGEICSDYKEKKLVMLCILDGACEFCADLSRQISLRFERHFVKFASYGNSAISSGKIEKLLDFPQGLNNKDVLIVEDIIDSGRTLANILHEIRKYRPSSIRTASLFSKPQKRLEEFSRIKIHYNGFFIPDEFIVGYGLDYAGKYRNFRHVAVLKKLR